MTLQLWLYLSSPVLSQISGETFLCSQPSDFNSCNSTKRPHSYTKLVSAKVINTLIPKFTRHFSLFNNLTWPVSKYNWKMLATCSFTKHSSICFCDTLLFCFFFFSHTFHITNVLGTQPHLFHFPEMDSLIYTPRPMSSDSLYSSNTEVFTSLSSSLSLTPQASQSPHWLNFTLQILDPNLSNLLQHHFCFSNSVSYWNAHSRSNIVLKAWGKYCWSNQILFEPSRRLCHLSWIIPVAS